MSDIALTPDMAPEMTPDNAPDGSHRTSPKHEPKHPTRKVLIYRTRIGVRLWHWINALSLFFLFLSGLQIFNAHSSLYWGQIANFTHPILSMHAVPAGASLRGVTTVFGHSFDTTGFLGASQYNGQIRSRGFPAWLTIPGNRDLESGRRWHFFFAWLFAINGALYFLYIFVSRHLKGDLWPTVAELKQIPRSILDHVLLRHPEGEAAAKFNVLQKLAYLVVLLGLLPLMILTGLTMSPGMDAAFPILPWAFAGRQSARTIHFICAWSIAGFFAIHIFEVFAAGVLNEMRSIVTGGFVIKVPIEVPSVPDPASDPQPTAPASGASQ
jgi:thiosulfate reductase cytochrome b subunit